MSFGKKGILKYALNILKLNLRFFPNKDFRDKDILKLIHSSTNVYMYNFLFKSDYVYSKNNIKINCKKV